MPWPHVSWSSPAIRPDPSRRFCDILQAVFGCGIAAGSVRVLENAVACHRKPLVVYPWSVSVMLLRPKFLTRRIRNTASPRRYAKVCNHVLSMETDLKFRPFRSPADPGWDEAWAIYQNSFPRRRSVRWKTICKLFPIRTIRPTASGRTAG